MFFVPAPYHIETGEAERIAVDHTSKPPEDGEGEASASEFLLLPKSFPFPSLPQQWFKFSRKTSNSLFSNVSLSDSLLVPFLRCL